MNISIINGSQKTGESNTGIILRELNALLDKSHNTVCYKPGLTQLSPEIIGNIASSDIIIFAFPLYFDSVPPNLLKILILLENYLKKNNTKDIVVYAVINNGFYEGRQTHLAFEIIKNWCE